MRKWRLVGGRSCCPHCALGVFRSTHPGVICDFYFVNLAEERRDEHLHDQVLGLGVTDTGRRGGHIRALQQTGTRFLVSSFDPFFATFRFVHTAFAGVVQDFDAEQ